MTHAGEFGRGIHDTAPGCSTIIGALAMVVAVVTCWVDCRVQVKQLPAATAITDTF
jgi:hypothetical protein